MTNFFNRGSYVPKFSPGDTITRTADGAVTAGRLVKATGDGLVGLAGAGDTVYGIAAFDAADGQVVTIHTRNAGVHTLVAAGAVTAGDLLDAADEGKVQRAVALEVVDDVVTPGTGNPQFVAGSSATDGELVEAQWK
jgi:hypothetical protein